MMGLKGILYALIIPLVIIGLDSININNIFKKNKFWQSRILYIIVAFALSYLVVNFLYDFFINTT
jgi:uncharacterized membrane protein YwzB